MSEPTAQPRDFYAEMKPVERWSHDYADRWHELAAGQCVISDIQRHAWGIWHLFHDMDPRAKAEADWDAERG